MLASFRPARDLRDRAGGDESWTDERVELLTNLWREGLSCSQIAARLGNGHTRCSVGGKARRLNLPSREKSGQPLGTPRSARRSKGASLKAHRPRKALRAPRVIVPATTWAPLPGSQPRPFWERRHDQCKWPIDSAAGTLSCCEAELRRGYCAAHAKLAFRPAASEGDESLMRRARR